MGGLNPSKPLSGYASASPPHHLQQWRIKQFWKGGGGRKTIYQSPSSFITNAHNELYAFYTEKRQIIE